MYEKHLIDKALITLEVSGKTSLFILLAKDGNIHRKGDGSSSDLPLMMGVSHQGHFEALMMTVDENIFQHTGVIKNPHRVGNKYSLTIIFQGPNDVDFSFRVIYGENSEGPPRELVEILINAVKITEAWYQQQLHPKPEEKTKSWWQFWK